MALVVNDRVKETSTTTGTGTFDLAGAATGFQTFVAGVGDTNTTYYAIFNQGTTEWEVGLGTVTDAATDTLARTTLISSSTGSAVDFAAGTKDVFCTLPASKAIFGKQEGTNFVGGLLVGHSTTGTLSTAQNDTGVGMGTLNALTTGDDNTCVGKDAGARITESSKNTLVGYRAGDSITTNSATGNTAVGYKSLEDIVAAGINNSALGREAGLNVTSGDYNVLLGQDAGSESYYRFW